ncbi:MAG TPA: trypsin-like peptidase domain-containing protein [Bryobacteraceae bacterium]|nr:trypsin-like peptidase domain-containing protein [Bryobacteraceae bacterium]
MSSRASGNGEDNVRSIGEVGEQLRRCTVEISARGSRGSGSGVIWPGTPAMVVTNAHVAGGESAMVRFWDGSESRAEPHRLDARPDLAALTLAIRPRETARIREAEDVRRGELVVAVGNPLGFSGALSTGVVHGFGPVAGLGRRAYIQAQVRLAPGNSGGPLADAQGRVIGINSMVVSGGLGLAIPASAVIAFLTRTGAPIRLGVTLRPIRTGLLVLEVEAGSRAETASLLPGDTLVAANGINLTTTADLGDLLDGGPSMLRLEFLRGGSGVVRRVAVPLEQMRSKAA